MRKVHCDKCKRITNHYCGIHESAIRESAVREVILLDRMAAIGFCKKNCDPNLVGHHKSCLYRLWNDDGTLRCK